MLLMAGQEIWYVLEEFIYPKLCQVMKSDRISNGYLIKVTQ